VAGVKQLVRDGIIKSGDRVVAVLTGHVLKDPGMLVEMHQQRDDFALANKPIEIDASVKAVADVIARRATVTERA
jgi:threonine synthase